MRREEERACSATNCSRGLRRTQFAMSVPYARRLFLNWGASVLKGDTMTLLHRVVFYGDYARPMQHLSQLMGFKVIEEGGPGQMV
ncbi:MAG: hypothetical protein ACLQU5_12565 [Isosphaeraceae bacterium]